MNRRKKKSVGSVIAIIVFFIALGVFVYAGVRLFLSYREYHEASVEYRSIAETAGMDIETEEIEEVTLSGDFAGPDFDALLAINSDIVGWIRFPEPEIINYPIVYSSDNENYLHHTFEKTYNFAGSIFIDMNNERDLADPNTVIYGHAMNDGSMFGSLKKYQDQEFYQEHPYFYLYTPRGGVYRYMIFAAYETTDSSETYQLSFQNAEEFRQYLENCKSKSIYDTGITMSPNYGIITLSTCTNRTDEGRFVVQAFLEKVVK